MQPTKSLTWNDIFSNAPQSAVPLNTRVVYFTYDPIAEDLNLKKEAFERLTKENKELVQKTWREMEGAQVSARRRATEQLAKYLNGEGGYVEDGG